MHWSWPCVLDLAGVLVQPARSKEDYERAFGLAYESYQAARMVLPNPSGLWFTPFHALPDSRVVLASFPDATRMAATGTVVFDSVEFGLPSDWLYRERLNRLRRQGRFVVEFLSLVVRPGAEAGALLFHVFRLLYRYAVYKGATDLVVSVRPEEAAFYERVLLFRRLGPMRLYPRYHSLYVVLEHMDLEQLPRLYAQVFGNLPKEKNLYYFLVKDPFPFDLSEMERARLSRRDFVYFFMERTNFWARISEEERAYFAYVYDLFAECNDALAGRRSADLAL